MFLEVNEEIKITADPGRGLRVTFMKGSGKNVVTDQFWSPDCTIALRDSVKLFHHHLAKIRNKFLENSRQRSDVDNGFTIPDTSRHAEKLLFREQGQCLCGCYGKPPEEHLFGCYVRSIMQRDKVREHAE